MFKGLLFFIKFGWKHEKRYIIYLVLNQLVNSLIPIVAVIMPKFIIEELMGTKRLTHIILYATILLAYTFLANMASNTLGWKSFGYRGRVATEFDIFIHSKTMNVDYSDLETAEYIEIREKARKFLFGNLHGFSYVLDIAVGIIGKIITLIGIIAVVASLNPILVLLFILLVTVNSIMESHMRKKQIKLSLELTNIERHWLYLDEVMENFAYGKEIRLNSLSEYLVSKVRQHSTKAYKLYDKSNSYGIKSGNFSALTSLLQQGIAYAYLVYQVLRDTITIGDFTMYVGGVVAFSSAMRDVMTSVIEVSQFRHYYDAMDKYLNIKPKMRVNKHLPLPRPPYKIEFQNVSFCYGGASQYALKDINITLKSGEKLSIVGENGAGKTTFVKLLCRIYDPTKGKILLNGANIKDIDYDEYMTLFSTVFQDYKLFSFSLYENVALGSSNENDKIRVEDALNKAGLRERLSTLPHGLDTPVYKNFNDEGFEPSGGEGQKIALARAIYKDAPIMILDEPTSALDPKAESQMYHNFNDIVSKDKTAIFISHRLASTQFCDKIAVFQSGKIVEYGSHSELMQNSNTYSKLYTTQSRYYK